jgi:cell division protein FtsQ
VVSGIVASDPLSTRAARMKIFSRFTSDLDSSGQKISEELSEVDLSNPEDVKALIPDHSNDILVHFGDTDFLERYRRFEEHLPEWRTTYPKLSSVDMRYERQVVLEMQPGSGVQVAGGGDAGSATAASGGPASGETKTTAKTSPAVHAASKAVNRPSATSKSKAAMKAPAHATGGAKVKSQTATVKHPSVVVGHSSGTPLYHPPQVVHP